MIKFLILNLFLATYISFNVYKYLLPNIASYITIPITLIIVESFLILRVLEYKFNIEAPAYLLSISYHIMGITFILFMVFIVVNILTLLHIPNRTPLKTPYIIIIATTIVYIYGYINSMTPIIKEYTVYTDKNIPRNLQIVLIADMHVDRTTSLERLNMYVDKINAIDADFAIFAGDIIDSNVVDMTKERIDVLRNINMPIYAALGNHDYYAGLKNIVVPKLQDSDLIMLVDEVSTIDNLSINIIGRDLDIPFSISKVESKVNRGNLAELIKDIDEKYLSIVIDHIPTDESIESAKNSNIDLLLSGHTHAGQMFPINLIVKYMYQNDYGVKEYDNTTQVVTSGIYLWGLRLRIATKAEIVVINVVKNDNETE